MKHGGEPYTHEISNIRLPINLGAVIEPRMPPTLAVTVDAVERTAEIQTLLSKNIPARVDGAVIRHLPAAVVGVIQDTELPVADVQRQKPAE